MRLHHGLYAVNSNESKETGVVTCIADSIEDFKLWHLRLGHIPFSKMQSVNSSFNNGSMKEEVICHICPKARQTRKPFSISTIRSTRCFELLHIDVWGPYKVLTHDKCSMFLTIVDDYSRHTWIFLLKKQK